MVAEKVRVYEIAKKLELSNKEVMDLLEEKFNIKVKSHASTIEKELADQLAGIKSGGNGSRQPAEIKKQEPQEKKPETAKEIIPKPSTKQESTQQPSQKTESLKPQQPAQNHHRQNFNQHRQDYRQGHNPNFRSSNNQDRNNNRPLYQPQPRNHQGYSDKQRGSFKGVRRDFRNSEGNVQEGGGRPPYQQGGFNNRSQGGFNNRFTSNRPPRPVTPAAGGSPTDIKKAPVRRDSVVKKKEKPYQAEKNYKNEEKLEQIKLNDKFKKKKKIEEAIVKEKITEVSIDKALTVGELAIKLDIYVGDVIKQLMMSGILATVNQTIDMDSAKNVAEKLGFTVLEPEYAELLAEEAKQKAEEKQEEVTVDESKLKKRAPVVTIMGHVDHGKTTLLDSIRSIKHKIVNTEIGGITQSIGAYTVRVDDKKIVFIDTPGHEAFTAMRARGAQSTDIAILVVAADDGIMPQTIEAINHAKAAKVPIIVAVNKIDKPDADPDKVLQQLTEYDLVAEKWGGDTVCVPVSALKGTNLDELLEMILLVSDIQDLKADPAKMAEGVIIEAKLDKGKGAVATLLVQSGTLKIGDFVTVGTVGGKVRALISDEGERVKHAGPITPVEILGLGDVPQSGDKFEVVEDDKTMKNIINERKEQEKVSRLDAITPSQTRKEIISQEQELSRDLNIIIKANTHGSAEAVSGALQQLTSKQIFVKIVHIGVGDISEADVMLATASNAVIIGFSVKKDQNAAKIAANNGIDIKKYDIIYKILEDIERMMLGLLQPELKTIELGTAEVRQVFTVGKTTKIAGCYVLDGKIIRNKSAVVLRDGKEIYKGTIDQLKRFKDDVKEVATGYECGISFNKFNDIKENDIIKVSTTEEVERETLV